MLVSGRLRINANLDATPIHRRVWLALQVLRGRRIQFDVGAEIESATLDITEGADLASWSKPGDMVH